MALSLPERQVLLDGFFSTLYTHQVDATQNSANPLTTKPAQRDRSDSTLDTLGAAGSAAAVAAIGRYADALYRQSRHNKATAAGAAGSSKRRSKGGRRGHSHSRRVSLSSLPQSELLQRGLRVLQSIRARQRDYSVVATEDSQVLHLRPEYFTCLCNTAVLKRLR